MPRPSLGRPGLVAASAVVLALAGCAPDLPTSVVEGSSVTVGWSKSVTSLNAATRDGATSGNREIAAATRAQFARVADGDVVLDESFGSVEVIDSAAASFTVRYELAEPRWSDGVPLDAADLLLAWAAGANAGALAGTTTGGEGEFAAAPSALVHSDEVPELDEFDRRIDVAFTRPVRDWRTAVDVAVPAHVVGRLALGIEDPMEAKQAVISAIEDGDAQDLTKIAAVWNDGFDLDETADDIPEELLVASGPYHVAAIKEGGEAERGDRVRLSVNREYAGTPPPTYEHVELETGSPLDQLAKMEEGLDVAQFAPTQENRELIRDLERRDHLVSSEGDGTVWALVLRADRGVFAAPEARMAFLRAVPRSDLVTAGAGTWRDAYQATDSVLFGPSADGYTASVEDAGLRETIGARSGDSAFERTRAGVSAGTSVCVLHDTDEPFAVEAFAALQSAMSEDETGWQIRDCGDRDLQDRVAKGAEWQAVLTRIPLPESAREIATQWGSTKGPSLSGADATQRDQIIDKLSRTADPYDERDLRVTLEAQIVDEAIVLPLAVNPVVTIAARGIENVEAGSGGSATLLSGVGAWGPDE